MGCMIEYSLRSCDPHKGSLSECMAAMSTKWEVPYDMDLIFMYGHQHFAGLGVTLFRYKYKSLYIGDGIYHPFVCFFFLLKEENIVFNSVVLAFVC